LARAIAFVKNAPTEQAGESLSKQMVVSNLQRVAPLAIAFGALWYLLLAHLAQYWIVEPEYSFGWLVPVLGAYLFWLNWRNRPEPGKAKSQIPRWIFCIAAFALLPTWLVAQANPDWRLTSWLLAGEVISISLAAIYLIGGRPWLKHFAFGICLILAAVPWPTTLQSALIHGLTKLSTTLTVAFLNLLQIHAMRHGNIVELNTGSVGIDEACSGIQSLQAAVMLSLFLGELYRGSILQRGALVLGGGLAAFGCNLGRTLSLSIVGAKQGIDVIPTWHDPLGYAGLTICFLLVWVLARIICGPLPRRTTAAATMSGAYPYRMIVGLGIWVLLTIVGTETWYRAHDTNDTLHWSFRWPVDKQTYTEIPLTNLEAKMLRYDRGRGAEWSNEDNSHWVAYSFKWDKGPSWSRILARGHRPEVCYAAAGSKSCADHGMITVEINGLSIPFHALDFELEGEREYVFYCVWEEGAKNSAPPRLEDRWSQLTRLRSVLLGQRNLGQQTLEIVISGVENQQKAEAAFRREVVTLIDIGSSDLVAEASSGKDRK
jgi:exosortase